MIGVGIECCDGFKRREFIAAINYCIGSYRNIEPNSFDVVLSFVESEVEHKVISVGWSGDRWEG